ncbi:MAG: hypothetical protein HC941_01260 [Microcoleus sp. SU_5_3]|nr:hypothetical protein [Microcoleus sp. SU_5_3]
MAIERIAQKPNNTVFFRGKQEEWRGYGLTAYFTIATDTAFVTQMLQ